MYVFSLRRCIGCGRESSRRVTACHVPVPNTSPSTPSYYPLITSRPETPLASLHRATLAVSFATFFATFNLYTHLPIHCTENTICLIVYRFQIAYWNVIICRSINVVTLNFLHPKYNSSIFGLNSSTL